MKTGRYPYTGTDMEKKTYFRADFGSIDELAEKAFATQGSYASGEFFEAAWQGAKSAKEVRDLAKHGWQDDLPEVMSIASEAVETVDREYELMMFKPIWDVTGCEVDVGRYLANEPENMIDYVMTPTVRSGRVVTICSSVCYSAGINAETIQERGRIVTALTLAVSRLGYGVELYADAATRGGGCIRVLVKGTHDEIDPAKIMYAYAHPSMLRTLIIGWTDATQTDVPKELKGFGYSGSPIDPPEDLPYGTLYLPSVVYNGKVPPASEELTKHLKELGII